MKRFSNAPRDSRSRRTKERRLNCAAPFLRRFVCSMIRGAALLTGSLCAFVLSTAQAATVELG